MTEVSHGDLMVSALPPQCPDPGDMRAPPVTGRLCGDLVVTGGPDGVSAVPKVTGRSPRCQQDLRVTEVSPR